MNKRILVLTLLTLVMLTTPLIGSAQAHRWGQQKEKIPVEWYIMGFSSEPGEGYSIKTYDCGIQIERNKIVTFDPISLVIDGSSTPLVGTVVNNIDSISNLDKNTQVAFYKSVMSFSTIEGGFKGYSLAIHKEMHTPDWYLKWTIVFHGYGEFEGQTLMMLREGPYPSPPGTPVKGYLLKP